MEKILILGCKQSMNDVCIACSRCMVGFNKRVGDFERYKDADAELVGIINCGDCPGASVVTRLAQLNLWNAKNGEIPTKLHVAPCLLDHCPYKDEIMNKLRNKVGIEIVEGTHPYMPENIFAQ